MINVLIRRTVLAALMISLLFSSSTAPAESTSGEGPRYRALLIACDEFVEETSMSPIGENNLRILEAVLRQDTRGFEIKRQYGITSTAEMLAQAVAWAFQGAQDGDVSLLYISTHGAFDTGHNNPQGELILSDGSIEERISAQALNAVLDQVPGTKVLLVDACNSGALIRKGVSPDVGSARVPPSFLSPDYKVLTSSGASEPSWYLLPNLQHAPPGSSYFTTALATGAGLIGSYAADANRDGTITLKEMYDYLWVNQASSAVQLFPQDDGFPLIVYDLTQRQEARGELTGFVFSSGPLDAQSPVLEFSYTATVETKVAYRITYLQDGQWDWMHGETLLDASESEDGAPSGDVSPGRKLVSLPLQSILPTGWSYAMIHVMTLGNGGVSDQPFIYASRVFSAQQANIDPGLQLRLPPTWNAKYRRELEIFVMHEVPCSLSVAVRREDGSLVRRLMTSRATRPQGLSPDGSLLYWDGTDGKGDPVQPGTYVVEASTQISGVEYTAEAKFTVE